MSPRAAIAGSLALGLTLLGLGAAPAAADCLPAAVLSGETDTTTAVRRALAGLGVFDGEASGACPAIVVTLVADEAGIAVMVRDGRGRIEGRVVADAHTAAVWIESWANDAAAPLWSAAVIAPAVTPPAATPPGASPAQPPRADDLVAAAPARGWSRWLPSLTVRLGRDLGSDDSTWDGLTAAACLRLGRLCVGAAVQRLGNHSFSAETGGLTRFDRRATVVAATAAVRLPIARVVLAPELVAGLGRISTWRDEPIAPCIDADGTPCSGEPLRIGDGARAATTAARLGAGLGVAVPLTRWLWLDGRVGAELAPGARTAPLHPDAPATDCDPLTDDDCIILPVPADDPLLDLPAEPAWSWGAAIGLRVELP